MVSVLYDASVREVELEKSTARNWNGLLRHGHINTYATAHSFYNSAAIALYAVNLLRKHLCLRQLSLHPHSMLFSDSHIATYRWFGVQKTQYAQTNKRTILVCKYIQKSTPVHLKLVKNATFAAFYDT